MSIYVDLDRERERGREGEGEGEREREGGKSDTGVGSKRKQPSQPADPQPLWQRLVSAAGLPGCFWKSPALVDGLAPLATWEEELYHIIYIYICIRKG